MLAPEDILRLEELIQDAIKDVPEHKSVFVAADVMNAELRRLGFVRLTDEAIRKGLAAAAWATASMAFLDDFGVFASGRGASDFAAALRVAAGVVVFVSNGCVVATDASG